MDEFTRVISNVEYLSRLRFENIQECYENCFSTEIQYDLNLLDEECFRILVTLKF